MRACAGRILLRRSRAGRAGAEGAGIALLGERDDVTAAALFFANGCRLLVVTRCVRHADDARRAQICGLRGHSVSVSRSLSEERQCVRHLRE